MLVVVTECLVREVHNDVHSTDRHTVSVLTSRVNLLEGFFLHTHHGTTTHTPLLVDDTTLLVNLLVFEEKVMAPVVKDEETRVNGSWNLHVHVVDVIYCLVKRSVGVKVLTELDTNLLEILLEVVTREVLRSVETHVLKEVSKTELVIFLLHRTYVLSNIEECSLLWPLVVTNVISQTVWQSALLNLRVCWHIHVLC